MSKANYYVSPEDERLAARMADGFVADVIGRDLKPKHVRAMVERIRASAQSFSTLATVRDMTGAPVVRLSRFRPPSKSALVLEEAARIASARLLALGDLLDSEASS